MAKKVLITDDAMFMRVALKNILTGEGYEVIEADDGSKSVAMYDTCQPDLVVMDITMPVMDGITAIRKIIEKHPDAKVVICSAMGQKHLVLEAIQAGAKDYIVKPFQPDRVIDGVESLIGKARAA